MKDLGSAQKILGMEIRRDRVGGKLWLSQSKYITKVLEKFNMLDCKPVSTPLAEHFKLSAQECPSTEEEKEEMSKVPYASLVGCLDDLDELDWEYYRTKYRNIGRLDLLLENEGDMTNNYKLAKQADTIMLVHLNAARDQAHVISFPRDMYVTIPGYGQNKINAAYSLGGPPLTVRTMEDLTGARMDHVVLVDFDGFVDLSTDLGGVTVTNDHAFSSHGYTYPEGRISIAGEEALWFVRERYALPEGDLDRAENQRKVIKAIVQKGLSAEVLSDPARFTTFIANVSKHLTVDNNLSDAEIRRTALSLRLSGSDIELMQAPLSGFGTSPQGQSIDIVDTAKLAELSTALKQDDLAGYLKKYPKG